MEELAIKEIRKSDQVRKAKPPKVPTTTDQASAFRPLSAASDMTSS